MGESFFKLWETAKMAKADYDPNPRLKWEVVATPYGPSYQELFSDHKHINELAIQWFLDEFNRHFSETMLVKDYLDDDLGTVIDQFMDLYWEALK